MYNKNNRPVVALLVFLAVAEGVVMGCLFGIPRPLVGTNNPAPGVFICADGDQPGHPWVAFYFTSTLAIETILLLLSLWKAWHAHKTGLGGGLMKVLTRDSVYYFAIIFWVYLANQIIWIVNDITLNELATGFGFSISSILANRLMISVRSTYYLQEHLPSELRSIPIGQSISNRPPSTMGIVAEPEGEYDDHAGPSHAPRGGEEFELATFNDSRGF
ncbi:hypothetical protein EWM64_g6529 [Hericium alpestre]|uniref:Uncharacterized protein n=1 Tax=Hericium alpestre TaxID=135208 RepID=A0A4Y9ZTZ1_9AGAM|nr:hypothetical protein EWM64_g6529 [Hericium alpestre]